MRFFLFFSLAALLLIQVSCASSNLETAFTGGMERREEIKTIVDYCQSCHIHRNLNPGEHLSEVTARYGSDPYRSAGDCKTCHGIEKNFWNDIVRYTYFPGGSLVGERTR